MTTNKPEVVAWIKETWRSATESRPVVHDWEDNGSVVSPLVRLSDYEALQAKCKEEIYRALQYRDAHFEALMQAIEQVDAMKAECEQLRKDSERLDWIESQAKKSPTGISFDYHKYVEDGYVLEHGFRFMRRHFASGFKDNIRKAIDAAMAGGDQ